MSQNTLSQPSEVVIRSLTEKDFEAVVALDGRITGGHRRGYYEKRLKAALRQPKRHLQLAATSNDGLTGFVLARAAGGEYGRQGEVLAVETVGVDPSAQHAGVGRRLMAALEERARARGIGSFITQVHWQNHGMMRFVDSAKFKLAPHLILERKVHRMPLPETDEEIETRPPLVRHLSERDFDMVLRIDRQITGRDRSDYLRRKIDEALNESAIAVSLVAEDDGFVVAFAMVRVDFGDFGHVESTASLETIGVNPGFARKGFARALLTQMIDNLSALHVERLETEVEQQNFDLLRFLHRFGFGPSARLPFVREL